MALGYVLVGIVAGVLAAGSILVLGGGARLVVLGYFASGSVAILVGMVSAMLPRHRVAVMASQDQG